MAGGLTYGASKDILATVVENGICSDDPRVLVRTNEATKAILDEIIPVGGMITADVIASGTNGDEIFLPKEFENAIEVEVLNGNTVNGQTDIQQGWYNIVNQFAYVSPDMAHDNPLVDLFLQPDPLDATILRRKYQYPGLAPNATVRVTGAKRYVPLTGDGDFMIVQNLLAVKDMIQAIEKGQDGNDPQGAEACHKRCMERLGNEVKKHQLDPINSLKRKAQYDADLLNLPINSFGWMRARLAFVLPNGLNMGKSELTRALEHAEMTLMDAGQWVGTIQEYTSQVTNGTILAPREVDCILDATWRCAPLNIHSWYFRYQKHGNRWWGNSHNLWPDLRDEGEVIYEDTGDRRRQYRLHACGDTDTHELRFLAALKWVKKTPSQQMTIRNFNAIRIMTEFILGQDPNKYAEAINEVDKELSKFLSGQILVAPIDWGMNYPHSYYGGTL